MILARPSGRFPAAQRIRKRPDFLLVQGRGRRVTTPHFILVQLAHPDDPARTSARLGVTVSRKVGNAVTRARAKRLVREAFRATRELWASDVDLVVIVRSAEKSLGLQQVVTEWLAVDRAIRRRAQEARRDRDERLAVRGTGQTAQAMIGDPGPVAR